MNWCEVTLVSGRRLRREQDHERVVVGWQIVRWVPVGAPRWYLDGVEISEGEASSLVDEILTKS